MVQVERKEVAGRCCRGGYACCEEGREVGSRSREDLPKRTMEWRWEEEGDAK